MDPVLPTPLTCLHFTKSCLRSSVGCISLGCSTELGTAIKWMTVTCHLEGKQDVGIHTGGIRPPEDQGGGDAGSRN